MEIVAATGWCKMMAFIQRYMSRCLADASALYGKLTGGRTIGRAHVPANACSRGSHNCGIMLLKDRSMDVHFDVPEELARQFNALPGGIARAAVEALAAEGVRSGKLTVYQARQMLGIRSRYEMDGFLKARGLLLSDTIQQIVADSETAIAFSK